MAKKKSQNVGSPVGYGPTAFDGNVKPTVRDNNPDGPSNLPDWGLNGYRGGPERKQICFPEMRGRGESSDGDDVNVVNCNGISNAKNKGRGVQYNWGDGLEGKWNKNDDWDGANISGL